MYKTAVITDEISQDIRVAAQMAREYGLNGLEIRSVNERNPFFMTKEDTLHVKQVVDEFGLEICGVSSPLFKCSIDDEATTRAHVEAFKRMMDTMEMWNTKIIRGFPFFNLNDGEKRFGEVVEKFEPILRTAKDAGVTVVIESEPSVYTANIESLIRFLKLIDDPCVQAVYDPGNEIVDVGTPPPYPDGYEKLKPYIRHVHVKDILRVPGSFVPAMLGEGSVDFDGIFKRLKQEYNGYVSVETHYRIRTNVSEEDLVHPQGSSFSNGGYEATQAYLNALRDRYHWMEG